MNAKQLIILSAVLLAGAAGTWWLMHSAPTAAADAAMHDSHDHAHGHGAEEDHDEPRGPHGGRLLEADHFSLELTIFESGVPPEFRVYPYHDGNPMPPGEISLTIRLERFGGRMDTIRFEPNDPYLRGLQTVEEPHSFRVLVEAVHDGQRHEWAFESYEGRTELLAETQAATGVVLGTSGPHTLLETLRAQGWVLLDRHRVSHVTPRFGGILLELRKRIGDRVAPGDVLAVIEVNETLRPLELRASQAGEVVDLRGAVGEFIEPGSPIYEIADLSRVWIDLYVPFEHLSRVRIGQAVRYVLDGASERDRADIALVAPVGNAESQTFIARLEVPNPDGRYRPGQHVTAAIAVGEMAVAVAVPASALQTFRDWDVVFLNDGTVFQAQPVQVGHSDGEWVEIKEGLEAGQSLVVSNSFLIKADILKSGASHDH